MFWNLKSKEFLELKQELDSLKISVETMRLNLELYIKKLKATKGVEHLQEIKEISNSKDLKESVFLTKDGLPLKPR